MKIDKPRGDMIGEFFHKQYYSFQINLIFPPLAGTGRESIVLETVVLQRDLFVPFACT
jgi:hypothetical protein